MIYIILIVAVLVIDRIVKIAVNSNMNPGDTFSVIGDFFHITYVQNTGAAFSVLQGHSMILTIIPAILILIGIGYVCVMHKKMKPVFNLSVSLICGGGLGNMTDRMAYGYVVDMFDFGSFPVFNVADIAVCVGCGLLALYMIRYEMNNPGEKK